MNRHQEMDANVFINKAQDIVQEYYNANLGDTFAKPIRLHQIYVVWFTKTLQNWKAMVSTEIQDGLYYEVTYNGDKRESYLDVYERKQKFVIYDSIEDRPRRIIKD